MATARVFDERHFRAFSFRLPTSFKFGFIRQFEENGATCRVAWKLQVVHSHSNILRENPLSLDNSEKGSSGASTEHDVFLSYLLLRVL